MNIFEWMFIKYKLIYLNKCKLNINAYIWINVNWIWINKIEWMCFKYT